MIQHEIQPNQFEIWSPLWVKSFPTGLNEIHCDFLHLRYDFFLEGVRLVGVCCLHVPLEVIVAELIGRLVISVVGTGLLDISCKVDEGIEFFESELHAAGADVALIVPIYP